MNNLLKILSLNNANSYCLDRIQAISKEVNVKSHQNILNYGDTCNYMYFVLKGGFICKYWSSNSESERAVNFYLDTFQPFMISIDSYFNNTESQYSLESYTNSDILVFKKEDLESLEKEDVFFETFFRSEMIKALIAENKFRTKLIVDSPKEIYNSFIKEYPEVIKKVPSKYIADFIGVSAVWLSNLKKEL